MYDLTRIRRKSGKRRICEPSDPFRFNPFESRLPFYSVVPEDRWKDPKFLQLSRNERGDFCLLSDFFWRGCGGIRRSELPEISQITGVGQKELEALVEKMLDLEMAIEKDGRLILPELRLQYLRTLQTNANRGRSSNNEGW